MDEAGKDGVGVRAARIMYPLFVGQGFGIIFTALTFIVVARLLGPSGYGVYTFAFGFAALINGFMAFGVGAYFSSALAKLAYRKDWNGVMKALSSGYTIAGVVGIILTLFGVGVSWYVSSAFSNLEITASILILVSGTIISSVLNTLAVSALIGLSRSGLASSVNVLVDMLQLLLSVLLTIMFGVMGAVAGMLVGYAVGAAVGAYLLYRVVSEHTQFRVGLPSTPDIKKVFSVVWPLAATNFLNTGMQNFSIIFLGLYVNVALLGNYGAASKGLALLAMMYGIMGSGLLPIFGTAMAMKRGRRLMATYNSIIGIALIPMLAVVVYVGAMSVPGLHILVGGSYAYAPLYLTLIAAGTMIGIFSTCINQLLIAAGKTMSVMKVNLASAVVQLAFMLVLVPLIMNISEKVVGAIAAIFFIGNAVEAVLFARDARRLLGLKLQVRKLLLIYAGSIVLGLVLACIYFAGRGVIPQSWLTAGYVAELAAGAVVTLLLYPAILVALKAFDAEDIRMMRVAVARLGKAGRVFTAFLDYSSRLYAAIPRW